MKGKRMLALLLALCMLLALSGCGAAAVAEDAGTERDAGAVESLEDTAVSLLTSGGHSNEAGKEETVYVIADASGIPQEVLVSCWVKNAGGEAELADRTELTGIENTKGDEGYTSGPDGAITWDAGGSDIYYQGRADKGLPVDVAVRYELDGRQVTPEELAGASGHLTITFQYTNNTGKRTVVDGESCTIYQPYVMVSGLLLDNEKAENVTVTNGKVINDGERSVVVGLAMPGLKESLGWKDWDVDLDIPETVVVEADVTDFSLLTTLTVASGDALGELGLDEVKDLDDLKDKVAELTDGSQTLVDGASAFSGYMGDLNSAAGQLSAGADTVDTYMQTLSDGLGTLQGAVAGLPDGAAKLLAGTQALSAALKSGYTGSDASKYGVYEALSAIASGADSVSAAASGIMAGAETVAAGADQIAAGAMSGSTEPGQYGIYEAAGAVEAGLEGAAAQLAEGLEDACAGLDAAGSYSQSAMDVLSGVVSGENLTEEQRTAISGAMQAVGANQQYVSGVKSALAGTSLDLSAAQAALEGIRSGAQTIAVGARQISCGVKSGDTSRQENYGIYEAAHAVKAGADQLAATARQLMAAVDTMTNGENLGAIISGLEELSGQSAQLLGAVDTLSGGAGALAQGTGSLSSNLNELEGAVAELYDNSILLRDGMNQLDSDGIRQIADLVNGDLERILHRIQSVQEYAEEWESFSGCPDGVDCSTRFVYKTGAIGAG